MKNLPGPRTLKLTENCCQREVPNPSFWGGLFAHFQWLKNSLLWWGKAEVIEIRWFLSSCENAGPSWTVRVTRQPPKKLTGWKKCLATEFRHAHCWFWWPTSERSVTAMIIWEQMICVTDLVTWNKCKNTSFVICNLIQSPKAVLGAKLNPWFLLQVAAFVRTSSKSLLPTETKNIGRSSMVHFQEPDCWGRFSTRWWFQTFFYFHPYFGGMIQFG